MMNQMIAVVGDVHGRLEPLLRVANWATTAWTGSVVFVGDYVNKGPDSKSVIEILLDLRQQLGDRLTLLLGNHEVVLLDFLAGGEVGPLLRHGGLQTMRSYLGDRPQVHPFEQFRRDFPRAHRQFLEQLELAYETDDLLITHAGYNPAVPLSRKREDIILGRFPSIFTDLAPAPKELVVCGHYVQRGQQPFESDRLICLDTGCGSIPGAPLTVLLLPDRQFGYYF